MYRIICYTLFDITNTGVLNRNRPSEGIDPVLWLRQRNTQCNFDTILQAISLRSQPELVSVPIKKLIRFDEFKNFGSSYKQKDNESYPMWSFIFEVQHSSVFENDYDKLGGLYNDCDRIPMIKCGTEYNMIEPFLNITTEFRNIYFTLI